MNDFDIIDLRLLLRSWFFWKHRYLVSFVITVMICFKISKDKFCGFSMSTLSIQHTGLKLNHSWKTYWKSFSEIETSHHSSIHLFWTVISKSYNYIATVNLYMRKFSKNVLRTGVHSLFLLKFYVLSQIQTSNVILFMDCFL